ncbi:MAG: hypothetical protein Q8N15_02270, partial [Bacillota bacterium]|nr:hypothetical protein [Bacillota bacterium]
MDNETTASASFQYDIAPPSVDETAVGTGIAERASTFSLIGSSSDTNPQGIASVTVHQRKDSGNSLLISTNGPTNGGSWTTWNLSNLPRDPDSIGLGGAGVGDGQYEYIITATDAAGRATTLTRYAKYDSTGPSLTIVEPSSNSWIASTSTTATGVANDGTGVGVETIQYSSVSGAGPWSDISGGNAWSVPLSGLSEGLLTYYFRAVDHLGNAGTSQSRVFGIDLNKPTVNSSTPSSNVNTGFSFSGVALDSYRLVAASITVTQKKDAGSAIPIGTNGPDINVVAGNFVIGQNYTIVSTGTTDFTLIGAANSNSGTVFTASGSGTGTGTARGVGTS